MNIKALNAEALDSGEARNIVWLYYLAAALAVWISADLSRFLSVASSGDTSAIWPPLGIGVAASWVFGRRFIPVYAGVIGLWFGAHGYSFAICVLFMAEQGIEVFAIRQLYWRATREQNFLSSLTGALRFYLYSLVVVLLPAAGLTALTYYQFGHFTDQPFIGVWMFQWLPEAMGVALFAPPAQRFFSWCRWPRHIVVGWSWLFLLLFLILLAVSTAAAAVNMYNYARGLDYLFFPLLVTCALCGYTRTALSLLPLAAACTLVGVYLGTWATDSQAWNALGEALAFTGALTIMTQLVLASTVERTGLITSLREASRRDPLTGELNRAGLIERTQDGDWIQDRGGVCVALTLRNFARARELLPPSLVDAGESWVIQQMRALLVQHRFEFALARLDKGLYCAVVAPGRARWLESRLFDLVRLIRGKNFADGDWNYQLDPTIGAIPFESYGQIDDLVTATCYSATDALRTTANPVHIGADYTEMLRAERDELKKVEQIKSALADDGFVLFGQLIRPLPHAQTRTKVELLLRMRAPDGRPMAPGVFMGAANRFGYMVDIDRWVIQQAFAEVAARPALREQIAEFSINLSGASLGDSDTGAYIEAEITRSQLPASLFCFEITETETIADWATALQIIQRLQTLGFAISLDDFGTGLASFDYLNHFAFDYVKIDGAFVRDLDDPNSRNREIVEAIVLVARRRAIRTIAEFVENDAIAAQLTELGVDYMQGFGVHRPAPLGTIGD